MSLQLPSTIWVATAPINLRLSFDRLAGIVRAELGGDPKQPLLVMFHNRRRTHAKLLWHDGYAYCLFYKRLDRGRTFRIPLAIPPDAKSVVVDERELQLILRGLNHKLLRKADAIVAAIRAARKS
jgi:transposase